MNPDTRRLHILTQKVVVLVRRRLPNREKRLFILQPQSHLGPNWARVVSLLNALRGTRVRTTRPISLGTKAQGGWPKALTARLPIDLTTRVPRFFRIRLSNTRMPHFLSWQFPS